MRSDYALYTVSIIFFVITALVFAINLAEFERNLSAIATVILGLLFIGLGFSQRPKLRTTIIQTPKPAMPEPKTTATIVETVKETVAPPPEVPVSKIALTEVKGIKDKRAGQLKALGINSAEDLAKASPTELAAKLKIATYFTEKWIENAKKLVGKS